MSFYPSASHTFSLLNADTLKKAYYLMCLSTEMNQLYEENPTALASVLSTARGHEAIQIAAVMHLKPQDFLFPSYRDDAMFLAAGISPYELLLEALGKSDAPVSGGIRSYLEGSLYRDDMPAIPMRGAAHSSHVITATALAQGWMYLVSQHIKPDFDRPVVLCSLDDSTTTEGDIAEAFHIAVSKKLPIIYLLQDNDWCTATPSEEIRAVDGYELAGGFKGMKRLRINGADFVDAYDKLQVATDYARLERMPVVVHAKCPLLGHYSTTLHHQDYRTDENMELHQRDEPLERLRRYLLIEGETEETAFHLAQEARTLVRHEFEAVATLPPAQLPEPPFHTPTSAQSEKGERNEQGSSAISVRQAAIRALDELLSTYSEAVYYGTDAASQPGGRYKEAEGLALKHGNSRVCSMPYTGAYLTGSVTGLALAGCKPIVALSAHEALASMHQWQQMAYTYSLSEDINTRPALIRVCMDSVSLENILLQVPGLLVAYPSCAADIKGFFKAAWGETQPVAILEHTSLYELAEACTPEPDAAYLLPFGKARVVQQANPEQQEEGYSTLVMAYGPAVHWATRAAQPYADSVEILDLRSLHPLDWDSITTSVRRHGKVLILTPAPQHYSFAEALAAQITELCFPYLDSPVQVCGSDPVALSVSSATTQAAFPDIERIQTQLHTLLNG